MSNPHQHHRDVYLPMATRQEEVCIDVAAQNAMMAMRHLSTDDAFHAIRCLVRNWIADAYVEGDGGARGRIARAILRVEGVMEAVNMKREHASVCAALEIANEQGRLLDAPEARQ